MGKMHPRLSIWHRVVVLALILIATVYVIDLTVVPSEDKSYSFRLNPFSIREKSTCSNDEANSNHHRNPKELDLHSTVVKKSARDTDGWTVGKLDHYRSEEKNSIDGGEDHEILHLSDCPWNPEIEQWLGKCGEAAPILVPEQFANRVCEDNCRGRGVCNHEAGNCRCFHGYDGKGCELEQTFPCFDIDSESKDWITHLGRWRVSKCGASCDMRRSFCYCGEGTKYPDRPVPESCGFIWKNESQHVIDWDVPDPSLFSNSNESVGWCNLSVEDLSTIGSVPNGDKCDCKYDGVGGLLCEIPVESFCINQCSGNGQCQGGSCACVEGWHGIDCSIPSSLSSLKSWPDWLVPGVLKTMDISKSWEQQSLQVVVERRRPLIYVYELPARFNSLLLEGRHWRYHCATRLYDQDNETIWNTNLYGSEVVILETLLTSVHRTANAEEADFYYVPVLGACAIQRADEAPHMKLELQKEVKLSRTHFSGELYREAYEYVRDAHPYWNQSKGRDHIWLFAWDEGACAAPKEIWNSMMLVHWGNTNSKYNYSTTAYSDDSWNNIPADWRGNHPCYDPEKDLVIPAWKLPDSALLSTGRWARTREERPTLFYFNGNLGADYWGRVEPQYSMGLRQKLASEFSSQSNKNSKVGKQMAPDVVVTYERSDFYGEELSRSRFCGVLPGDGWSGRMEDSILHGCIPVIIQDGIHLPFENVLNYDEFTLRVAEDDLPRLISILRAGRGCMFLEYWPTLDQLCSARNLSNADLLASSVLYLHYFPLCCYFRSWLQGIPFFKCVSNDTIDSMLSAIKGVRQRFIYISAYHQEAKREKQKRNGEAHADWIERYNEAFQASIDDAFSTIIQVLHFKLYNRTWMKTTSNVDTGNYSRKDYCSRKIPS